MKTAFIALGSNLGDSCGTIEAALLCLQDLSVVPVCRSSLWRSSPVDCPPGSPDFINAVAAIVPLPGETPELLLEHLREIEIRFGRMAKSVLNEPRPLDLDLLAFGSEVRSTDSLILPHPRAHLRAFVLRPLAEVAPDFILPGQVATVSELAGRVDADLECIRLEDRGSTKV